MLHRREACRLRCDCGTERVVAVESAKRHPSCGCLGVEVRREKRQTHGQTGTRLYRIWTSMKTRCRNPRAKSYRDYGGRGITVCQEWAADFLSFRAWALANGYRDDLTIERIDNDRPYDPSNCVFATIEQQQRHRRHHRWLTCLDETKILADWVRDPRCTVHHVTIIHRLKAGWSPEEAVLTPPLKLRRSRSFLFDQPA